MIDNTIYTYAFVRGCIFLLRAIAPLSATYTAFTLGHACLHAQRPAFTIIQIYCLAETAFFLFSLWHRTYLQREALHPPLRSGAARQEFFDKICDEVNDPQKFICGWFRGAKFENIGRDDVKQFLSWVIWDGRVAVGEGEDELEHYTRKLEEMVGKDFTLGNGKAKPLRLTLDPIELESRSLFCYMLMMIVDTATDFRLRRIGFEPHRTSTTSLKIFPPRPAALLATSTSPAKHISYWLRPHTSKTRLPIFFIHGIGVGLWPYVDFFNEISLVAHAADVADDGQIGILVLEILQVSSRLAPPILRRADFLRELKVVLDFHGYERFVLMSHSYGSVLSTHILTDETLAPRVAATLLVDPVSILLHMPDVAYNFTIRKPHQANEYQLSYFGSKDPGVAHTLGRHFFWSENALWRDRITELVQSGMPITASLASRDLIVDTQAVGAYLMQDRTPDPVLKGANGHKHMELETRGRDSVGAWKYKPWVGQGLEVLWWEDKDHMQVFDRRSTRAKLVEVLVEYCRLT